jgi:hypothetical protein
MFACGLGHCEWAGLMGVACTASHIGRGSRRSMTDVVISGLYIICIPLYVCVVCVRMHYACMYYMYACVCRWMTFP